MSSPPMRIPLLSGQPQGGGGAPWLPALCLLSHGQSYPPSGGFGNAGGEPRPADETAGEAPDRGR
jgi:hypothetical protein